MAGCVCGCVEKHDRESLTQCYSTLVVLPYAVVVAVNKSQADLVARQEVGYADWELHCPQCPSDACVSCPVDVLCGRGWIYGSNKPSMGNRARVLVAAYALAMAHVLA